MNQDKFLNSKYGLKESVIDSFARKVPHKENLLWWTDRVEEIKAWNALVSKALKTSSNYIQFIIGDYGRGKTLSLLKISEDNADNARIFSIFMNLKGEEKSTPGLDLILRIFRSIDFNKISNKISNEILKQSINTISDNFSDLKQILWKIYFGSLESEQVSLFENNKPLPKNSTKELALNFLRGLISPSSAQLKELGVFKKLDKIDVAKEYLSGLLVFLNKLGYKTLLICIDEFEGLFSLVSKSQQSTYIALLRSLYDFPMEPVQKEETVNMILFIGSSEAGWESLHEMEKKESVIGGPTIPLLERIEVPIVLTSFSLEQTEELIEKILKYNRIEGKFEDEPLIPFTEDFVSYIYEITNGEPRRILVRTGLVLDEGVAEKAQKLDRKFAEKVLIAKRLT
ncbi:MAG: BREX system ATP-binding domain-containing protein [Ignavibacteriaceae bacterium]